MIIGTAGHVDHGKTALIRALTGAETDRLPEERRRGISIELGFAPLTLDNGTRVSIVDVPGHERFVRTMIAGASGIDAALLVVAADRGVMPQTREHCAILRALHVPVIAIAVTKVDKIASDDVAAAMGELHASLESLGVDFDVPVVTVSAVTGEGIAQLRAALTSAVTRVRARDSSDLFRFVVDRVFTLRGTGTVVTGTVWSGVVAAGDRVRALPGGRVWRIRAVHSHGAAVTRASAGDRFALALADAVQDDVMRGTVLVTDDAWQPTRRVVIRADSHRATLPRRFDVQLGGTVSNAGWSASSTAPGVMRLSLSSPLIARYGDRIVLRACAGADGIVGATVVDPAPERALRDYATSPDDQLLILTRAARGRGINVSSLCIRLGVSPSELQSLVEHPDVAVIGERAYDRGIMGDLIERVVAAAERHAFDHPFDDGSSFAAIRALVQREAHADAAAVDSAISCALAAGRLQQSGERLAPPGASLGPASADLVARLTAWVSAAGLDAPAQSEMLDAFGLEAEPALRYAERAGNLIRIGGVRYCAAPVVAAAVARLREAMLPGREYTPSELRSLLGVSRKYLIPLLEYCDANRVTVRHSGGRVVVDVSSR